MRRHVRIITAGVAAAVVVLVALAALLAGEPDPEPPGAGEQDPSPGDGVASTRLAAGVVGDPGTLDPHRNTTSAGTVVLDQLYDTLVRPGHDLVVRPALAVAWEADADLRTWTFELRDGVVFHDGSVLTADDVVASLQRVREQGAAADRLDVVEELRAVDDDTVEVVLRRPAADLPARLASSPRLAIVPAETIAGDEVELPLPGTGPFRFSGGPQPPGTLVLAAAERHWAGPAAVGRLDVSVVADHAAGLAALRAGDLHWLAELDLDAAADLDDAEGLRVGRTVGLDHWHLGVNTDRAPLDDRAVRRALAHALDREAIVAAVRPGAASPNQTAIPARSPWHHAYAPFAHDPDRARELLEEAEVEELELELLATDEVAESIGIAEVVAEQLAAIGVEASVRTEPLEQLLQDLAAGEFDLYALGWAGGMDPDEVYRPVHHSEGERNYHGLADEELDELLDVAREEADGQIRRSLYAEATERIVDQAAHLYLYNPHVLRAWSTDLRGVTVRPDGLTRLDEVRLAPSARDAAGGNGDEEDGGDPDGSDPDDGGPDDRRGGSDGGDEEDGIS